MRELNKKNVIILSKSMINHSLEHRSYLYPFGCLEEEWYVCIYCEENGYKKEDVKHKLDCPVLIAKDILKHCED